MVSGVQDFFFRGTLRVMLGPLMENAFLIGGVGITLMKPPEVSFGIKIGLTGGKVGITKQVNIPGLPEIITNYLKQIISDLLVFPTTMKFPLVYKYFYKDVNNKDGEEIEVQDLEKVGIRTEYSNDIVDILDFQPLGICSCSAIAINFYGDGHDFEEVICRLTLTGGKEDDVTYQLERDTNYKFDGATEAVRFGVNLVNEDNHKEEINMIPTKSKGLKKKQKLNSTSKVDFIVCGPVQKLVAVVSKRQKEARVGKMQKKFTRYLFGSSGREERNFDKRMNNTELEALNVGKSVIGAKTVAIATIEPTTLPSDGNYSRVVLGLQGIKGSIELILSWRPINDDLEQINKFKDFIVSKPRDSLCVVASSFDGRTPSVGIEAPASNSHDPGKSKQISNINRMEDVQTSSYDQRISINTTLSSLDISLEGILMLKIVRASHLIAKDLNGSSDPFCILVLSELGRNTIKRKTQTLYRTLNPEFHYRIDFIIKDPRSAKLLFEMYDEDVLASNDSLGNASLSIRDIIASKSLSFEGPLKLKDVDTGEIFVKATFLTLSAINNCVGRPGPNCYNEKGMRVISNFHRNSTFLKHVS